MKLKITVLATLILTALNVLAITIKWDVDAADARAKIFTAYHGETLTFVPAFRSDGAVLSNVTASTIYYQTNGMGSAWWSTDGLTFAPSNDVGATSYRFFISAADPTGTVYRANGTLRMLASPGYSPNALNLPRETIDFAAIDVSNAPWATTDDIPTDAHITNIANAAASTKADASTVSALSGIVDTWSGFWAGYNVRVTITNYDSQVHIPSAKIEYKQTDPQTGSNTFVVVWDELTRWNLLDTTIRGIYQEISNKADRAWGYYDSHTGNYAPDGFTWISSPKIAIAGGLAYNKAITSEGAIWVLESNGLVSEIGGVESNGFFRISDDAGNSLFEIVKGDKRTVGATAGTVQQLAGFAITHLQVGYNVQSSEHPTIYVTRSLKPSDWKAEDDPSCVANVTWSGSSGAWIATVYGKSSESVMFVKAEYEVGGNTYIKQSAPVQMQMIVIGGVEYTIGTATISGNTVLTLTR